MPISRSEFARGPVYQLHKHFSSSAGLLHFAPYASISNKVSPFIVDEKKKKNSILDLRQVARQLFLNSESQPQPSGVPFVEWQTRENNYKPSETEAVAYDVEIEASESSG